MSSGSAGIYFVGGSKGAPAEPPWLRGGRPTGTVDTAREPGPHDPWRHQSANGNLGLHARFAVRGSGLPNAIRDFGDGGMVAVLQGLMDPRVPRPSSRRPGHWMAALVTVVGLRDFHSGYSHGLGSRQSVAHIDVPILADDDAQKVAQATRNALTSSAGLAEPPLVLLSRVSSRRRRLSVRLIAGADASTRAASGLFESVPEDLAGRIATELADRPIVKEATVRSAQPFELVVRFNVRPYVSDISHVAPTIHDHLRDAA